MIFLIRHLFFKKLKKNNPNLFKLSLIPPSPTAPCAGFSDSPSFNGPQETILAASSSVSPHGESCSVSFWTQQGHVQKWPTEQSSES